MTLKTIKLAALGALALGGSALLTVQTADARPFHRHGGHGGWHGGWVGPAIVGGLALGALAASPYYAYGASPYYRGYYGGDCVVRRRVVGYTSWGRPIVRRATVCY
jgi:hypothetical protein